MIDQIESDLIHVDKLNLFSQRHTLNTYKTAPVELRALIDEEQYETHRNTALYRSSFEIVKGTLDVGAATVSLINSLIFFKVEIKILITLPFKG